MAKRKKKLSREEAKILLRQLGINFAQDWFLLSVSEKADVTYVMKLCRYRQSASSKASGKSRGYSFYLSLQRKPRTSRRSHR